MKTLFICLLAFVISAFPQNHKKVKIFINSEFDLNKAAELSLDLEETWHGKSGNISLFVNDVIEGTGVQLPQFDNATQQKWADEQKKKEEQKED